MCLLSVLILCWQLTGFMNRADVCCTAAVCWAGSIQSVCELSERSSLCLPPFSNGEKLLTFTLHHENSVFYETQITLQ